MHNSVPTELTIADAASSYRLSERPLETQTGSHADCRTMACTMHLVMLTTQQKTLQWHADN